MILIETINIEPAMEGRSTKRKNRQLLLGINYTLIGNTTPVRGGRRYAYTPSGMEEVYADATGVLLTNLKTFEIKDVPEWWSRKWEYENIIIDINNIISVDQLTAAFAQFDMEELL